MDVQGAIWIGTLNRGLLYYHPSRYKFTTYSKTDFPGYPEKDLTVNRFAESSNGEIYLNCNGTFYRYSDEKDKRGTVTLKDFGDLPANIKEQLGNGQNFYQYRDKHYSTLIVDSHKRVWGGTPDGLDLYEDEKDVPITFYRENGLSNNFIQGLLEDRNGNIWVTTSHGITKVVTDENRSQIKLITYNSF